MPGSTNVVVGEAVTVDGDERDPRGSRSGCGYAITHDRPARLDRSLLDADAEAVAPRLVGVLLCRELPSVTVVARIVEVEAYGPDDPASHARRGPTPANAAMFAGAGTAYVYRSYGVHWCLNVAVGPAGVGAAVLVRAAVILTGWGAVAERRGSATRDRDLLRGPGRLTRGLGIDGTVHDGGDLVEGVAGLHLADDGWRPEPSAVVSGPRTGVSRAAERPWRFHLSGATEVSPYRRSPRAPHRR